MFYKNIKEFFQESIDEFWIGASTRERKFKFRFLISAFAIDRFGEGTVGAIIIFSMESLARFFHFGVLIGKLG